MRQTYVTILKKTLVIRTLNFAYEVNVKKSRVQAVPSVQPPKILLFAQTEGACSALQNVT